MILLMALMIAFASAGCATENKILQNWEMKVTKGDQVPYDGVIVPYDSYRYYQQDARLFPECKDRLTEIMEQSLECENRTTENIFMSILGGFVLGFLFNQYL